MYQGGDEELNDFFSTIGFLRIKVAVLYDGVEAMVYTLIASLPLLLYCRPSLFQTVRWHHCSKHCQTWRLWVG